MNFTIRSELLGKHALFSPSNYYWIRDNEEGLMQRYVNSFSASIGTVLHDIARKYIAHGKTMSKFDKKSVIIDVLESGIPEIVFSYMPFDAMFNNLINYVNDCVMQCMTPEVPLYYSDLFFGTTDAIGFNEKEAFLRINDLKTGTTKALMDQLLIYEALFFLDVGARMDIKPGDIKSELTIYQGGDRIYLNPLPSDIVPVIDKIVAINKKFQNLKQRRSS